MGGKRQNHLQMEGTLTIFAHLKTTSQMRGPPLKRDKTPGGTSESADQMGGIYAEKKNQMGVNYFLIWNPYSLR